MDEPGTVTEESGRKSLIYLCGPLRPLRLTDISAENAEIRRGPQSNYFVDLLSAS